MSGVLAGFFIVWAMIGVGWVVGRTGVLGPHGRYVLNRSTFFIRFPRLLVLIGLLESEVREVLSRPMLVAAISGLLTGVIVLLAVRVFTKRRGADLIMTAISGSSGQRREHGIPDRRLCSRRHLPRPARDPVPASGVHAAPILFVLHRVTVEDSPGTAGVLRSIVAYLTIIASTIGLLLVLAGVQIPPVALEPVRSLANMAIPAMLLAYGLSLYGSRPLAKDDGYRGFDRRRLELQAAADAGDRGRCGAAAGPAGRLPVRGRGDGGAATAQNVYVAAARYRASENLARDTVLITTIGTVLVLLLISAVLGV